ncbi:hypothetical protein DFH08DRAFT_821587 [Mycena albidolilacea]|uniref:Uncharacterized protein n=1 Tax=Mycena albidolilacea TaxID=1033008 RepID=A0AAD6Z9Y2_9AGAR|nr:hypothetical protein DFH08DRAFT_821587 [Mycena albidolilacea]
MHKSHMACAAFAQPVFCNNVASDGHGLILQLDIKTGLLACTTWDRRAQGNLKFVANLVFSHLVLRDSLNVEARGGLWTCLRTFAFFFFEFSYCLDSRQGAQNMRTFPYLSEFLVSLICIVYSPGIWVYCLGLLGGSDPSPTNS